MNEDDISPDLVARGYRSEAKTAELLGVKVSTLRQQRAHRRGPRWVKVGRLTLYRDADLFAYIEQGAREPAAADYRKDRQP